MATAGKLTAIMPLALLLLSVITVLCEGLVEVESDHVDNSTAAHDGPPKCQPSEFFFLGYCQTCETLYSWMMENGINLSEICGWQPTKRGKSESSAEELGDLDRTPTSVATGTISHHHAKTVTDRHSSPKLFAFYACAAFHSHVMGIGFNLVTECGWRHPRLPSRSDDGTDSYNGGDKEGQKASPDSSFSDYSWIVWLAGIILGPVITYSLSGVLNNVHEKVSKWIRSTCRRMHCTATRYFGASQACEVDVDKKSVEGNPQSTEEAFDKYTITEEPSSSTVLLNVSTLEVEQIAGDSKRTTRKSKPHSFSRRPIGEASRDNILCN